MIVSWVTAPSPSPDVSALNFESQQLGTYSPAQSVTVTNVGGSNLTINQVTVSAGWADTALTCTAVSIVPGGTCTIFVSFNPAVAGAQSGALDIVSDPGPGGGSSQTTTAVALNGSGSAPSTLTLVSTPDPALAGDPVTFTAAVTHPTEDPTPTGTVNFSETSPVTGVTTVLGSQALNGSGVAQFTTTTLAAGQNDISALYSGDGNYLDEPSLYVTETVIATATALSFNTDPVAIGHRYTVNATVTATPGSSGPEGTVTFFSEGQQVASAKLNGKTPDVATITATAPTTPGAVTWQAVYNGDSNDPSSQSPVTDETATNTTTKLSFNPDPATVGNVYTVKATVTSALKSQRPTGTVVFFSEGDAVGTALLDKAGTATFTAPATAFAGPVTWQAVYTGDTQDLVSESPVVDETVVAGP